MQKKKKIRAVSLCLIICLLIGGLAACKSNEIKFKKNQVLCVGEQYMTKSHAMVLLCGLQQKYENMFKAQPWSMKFGNSSLDMYMKEQVKNQLVQLAGMNMLAKNKQVTLSEDEEQTAKQAADEFIKAFSKEQLKSVGIKLSDVQELYIQYATAEKLYRQITKDVEQEISDDQARRIDLQVIYFPFNSENTETQTNSEGKNAVMEKANQVLERANAGENFESLATEFNEGQQISYHIGRGEMEKAFEDVAFQLTDGQISGLVEGKEGIYIIKCISNYNQTKTDANKESIYEKNCSEVFNKEYNQFLNKTEVKLNEKAWDAVEIVSGTALPDVDFLDIYKTVQKAE